MAIPFKYLLSAAFPFYRIVILAQWHGTHAVDCSIFGFAFFEFSPLLLEFIPAKR